MAKVDFTNFVKKNKKKVTEDDPRWNPATMGNKKWGKGYKGALNYDKGKGKPS